MFVQCFCHKRTRLLKNILVQMRHNRRIPTYRVFNKKNNLNPNRIDIFFHVHSVFNQFDNSQEDIGITQPAKHIIDSAQIFVCQSLRNRRRKRSKNHNGNFGIFFFNIFCPFKRINAIATRHGNNQFKSTGAKQLIGFFFIRNKRKTWRITQIQSSIFIKNLLVNSSVFFQHKCIVFTGVK